MSGENGSKESEKERSIGSSAVEMAIKEHGDVYAIQIRKSLPPHKDLNSQFRTDSAVGTIGLKNPIQNEEHIRTVLNNAIEKMKAPFLMGKVDEFIRNGSIEFDSKYGSDQKDVFYMVFACVGKMYAVYPFWYAA